MVNCIPIQKIRLPGIIHLEKMYINAIDYQNEFLPTYFESSTNRWVTYDDKSFCSDKCNFIYNL